jgi:membrane protein implicated in regulation of membrane protease activity
VTTAVIWIAAFFILVIVELNTLEFTCLSIGLGCLLAATASWLGLGFAWQCGIAALGGGLGLGLLAPAMRRRLLPADMRTGNDLIIGAAAEVVEAIAPPLEGKIKLDGVLWQAISDRPLAIGTHVYVTDLQGAKLTVISRGELEETRALPLARPGEEIARPESQRELP